MQINRTGNVNFGVKYVFDIGGSLEGGSGQVRAVADNGEDVFIGKKGAICPKGIKNNKDFMEGVTNKLLEAKTASASRVQELKEQGLDSGTCDGILFCVPGAPEKGNYIPSFPNIKYNGTDNSLKDLYFDKEHLMKNPSFSDMNLSDDCKILAVNDMMGAVTSAAKHLSRHMPQLFKPQNEVELIMVGGGCGIAGMKMKRNGVELISTENGHIPQAGNTDFEEKGASVRAVIKDYVKALNKEAKETGGKKISTKDCKKLIKAGNAKIATTYLIEVEKGSEEHQNLKDTGLFKEFEGSESGTVRLKLKGIKKDQHEKASLKAIDDFAEVMARTCITVSGAKGGNAVLLTGPLINGINARVEKNSGGNESLVDLIKVKINKINENKPSVSSMMKTTGLMDNIHIIPDIASNIQDGEILLAKGSRSDGLYLNNRLFIPKKAIREKVKTDIENEKTNGK